MDSRAFACNIKVSTARMVAAARASHIGGCFSMADILAVHFSHFADDRLFVSKGHAAAIVYAALAESGTFDKGRLEEYCSNGQDLAGHVNHAVPGVELSTGSLGHALPVAIGAALADRFHETPRHTLAILSDGECDEGSNWEAFLLAPQLKLGHLTVLIDYNRIQSFGRVEEVIDLEPFNEKFRAFNWDVIDINGHDHDEIAKAFQAARENGLRPTVIIANTVKGKGVAEMEDRLEWHYRSPSPEALDRVIEEIRREYS